MRVADYTSRSMKIVVADDLPASALDVFRSETAWTVDARSGRPPATLAADLADADALLVRSATKVDATLLDAAPQLRIVARAGTGVDNVDVDAASARGILVVNSPGANSISVAEHTWALDAGARPLGAGRGSRDEGQALGKEAVHRHRAARRKRWRSSGLAASARKLPSARVRLACASWRTTRTSRKKLRWASASSSCRSIPSARPPTI